MNRAKTIALLAMLCGNIAATESIAQTSNVATVVPQGNAPKFDFNLNVVAGSDRPVTSSNSPLRAVELYLCEHGINPSKQRTWTDQGDEQYREQLAMAGLFKGRPFYFFVGLCVDQAALEKCNKAALEHGMRSEMHGPYQLFFSDDGVGQEMIKTSKSTQDEIVAIFKAAPLSPQKIKQSQHSKG